MVHQIQHCVFSTLCCNVWHLVGMARPCITVVIIMVILYFVLIIFVIRISQHVNTHAELNVSVCRVMSLRLVQVKILGLY